MERKSDEKQALRARIRSIMQAMKPDDKFLYDMALHRNLMAHPWMQEADTILCYCSTPLEPDTRWLLGWGLGTGKQVALPVCDAPGEMHFCRVFSTVDVREGKYGILEPIGEERPDITEKSVCIVPGYAFTADGRRLGKGGGYYDRFLAAHPGLRTLGLTYSVLLQEEIPTEPHDIVVDAVITDRS